MNDFKEKLEEAKDKHREVRRLMLKLLTLADNPRVTKEKLKNELFNLYMKVK